MKNSFVVLLFILISFSCREAKNKNKVLLERKELDTISSSQSKTINKESLAKIIDFKEVLNTIENVKHTKEKHKDWMSDYSFVFSKIFELDSEKFKIKTTSYEYKKNMVFYLHDVKHSNSSMSIKSFLENVQGKPTEGYTGERILMFAMKTNTVANFIDIPANWNYIELKEELLEILYKNINSDIIECYRTKKCVYKDLRKTK
jgi:hypothetical protein